MDYGNVLRRAWDTVWEHKFLILLGVLVALSGGGGGGASTGGTANFDWEGQGPRISPPMEFPQFPEMPELGRDWGIPALSVALIVALVGVAVLLGLVVWVVSTIARGGLIAGADAIDAGSATSFGQAWRAGWQKGWTLLGIGIVPAIPGFILLIMGVVGAVGYLGLTRINGGNAPLLPNAAAVGILAALACLLVPVALVLGLLRTFANRACMLEDEGVLGAYKRGFSVLTENFGSALVLFLIQIVVGIGIGIAMIVPGLVMALCCLLWPVLILIRGTISAYFSTLWTLAWREWTGQTIGATPEAMTTA